LKTKKSKARKKVEWVKPSLIVKKKKWSEGYGDAKPSLENYKQEKVEWASILR